MPNVKTPSLELKWFVSPPHQNLICSEINTIVSIGIVSTRRSCVSINLTRVLLVKLPEYDEKENNRRKKVTWKKQMQVLSFKYQ